MLGTLQLVGVMEMVAEARKGDDQGKKIDAALDAIQEIVRYIQTEERSARDASFLARSNIQSTIR